MGPIITCSAVEKTKAKASDLHGCRSPKDGNLRAEGGSVFLVDLFFNQVPLTSAPPIPGLRGKVRNAQGGQSQGRQREQGTARGFEDVFGGC